MATVERATEKRQRKWEKRQRKTGMPENWVTGKLGSRKIGQPENWAAKKLGYRKIQQPKNSATKNKRVGKGATKINVRNNGSRKKQRK